MALPRNPPTDPAALELYDVACDAERKRRREEPPDRLVEIELAIMVCDDPLELRQLLREHDQIKRRRSER